MVSTMELGMDDNSNKLNNLDHGFNHGDRDTSHEFNHGKHNTKYTTPHG